MVVTERLPGVLKDRYAGATKVRDVKVESREDSSGELAVFVTLVLPDPPPGAETWPVDDLWELRRFTQEAIAGLKAQEPDWEMPWFVVFEPESGEDLHDEDELLDLTED